MQVNIEKALGYLNIQESLRSENLREYCMLKNIIQTQNKTNY